MMNNLSKTTAIVTLAALCAASTSVGQDLPAAPPQTPAETVPAAPPAELAPAATKTITLREFLLLPAVGHYGRLPLQRDAVEAQVVTGQWQAPNDGAQVDDGDGGHEAWRTTTATADGSLDTSRFRGGYAYATYDSPREQIMMLDATGHAAVYVNGEPHAGDPYGLGWLRLPVLIERGENTFLFHLGGDRFAAKLTPPPADVFFLDDDRTLPTLVRGEADAAWAAVPVVNASRDWLDGAQIECHSPEGETLTTPVAPIPPLSVRKIAFQVSANGDTIGTHAHYPVYLVRPTNSTIKSRPRPLAETEVTVCVVGPADEQVRTFRSRIDGSIQAYAIRPAAEDTPVVGDEPGLIVALHGAGVDGQRFLARYSPKDWAHVVAPTGRRPYGFDWEDWSRTDVLEVMDDVRQHFRSDPSRTYVTGDSMGGHGAWHLGVTFPDRFAAIGPSGGWPSFWSYGGGMPDFEDPDEIQSLMLRGNTTSDTLQMMTNLAGEGVCVLHGAEDRNVPVEQARFMRNRLAEYHPNFVYFEDPHADGRRGGASGDWPPMMEFFRHNALPSPDERKTIDFITADPGVSSRSGWVSIEAQQVPHLPSRVQIVQDPDTRAFVGQTQNVARLAIDVGHWTPDRPIQVTLDGQQLPRLAWPEADEAGTIATMLWFDRHDDRWSAAGEPLPHSKGPRRSGPFKAAFDNDVVLVYGTGGTPAENAWAEAKARYDAETFWYRGGGALEVLPDSRFDSHRDPQRNVILYGNAETNRAWPALLADSPVQVRRGEVRFGTHTESGNDLAVLFVYPRPASDTALVGVVAGTGPVGMGLTNRLRYFVSGVAYPDLLIFGPGVLTEGTADIRAWGYFGPDWKIDSGDIAWRDASL